MSRGRKPEVEFNSLSDIRFRNSDSDVVVLARDAILETHHLGLCYDVSVRLSVRLFMTS